MRVSLGSVVFGLRFFISKDLRIEKLVVGCAGGIAESGALGMELQRGLEALQGFIDLSVRGLIVCHSWP